MLRMKDLQIQDLREKVEVLSKLNSYSKTLHQILRDAFLDNEEEIERNYLIAQNSKSSKYISDLKIKNARWKLYLKSLVSKDLNQRANLEVRIPLPRNVASVAQHESDFPHLLILSKSQILKMYQCVDGLARIYGKKKSLHKLRKSIKEQKVTEFRHSQSVMLQKFETLMEGSKLIKLSELQQSLGSLLKLLLKPTNNSLFAQLYLRNHLRSCVMLLFQVTSSASVLKLESPSMQTLSDSPGFASAVKDSLEIASDAGLNSSFLSYSDVNQDHQHYSSVNQESQGILDQLKSLLEKLNSELNTILSKSSQIYQNIKKFLTRDGIQDLENILKELNFKVLKALSHQILLQVQILYHQKIQAAYKRHTLALQSFLSHELRVIFEKNIEKITRKIKRELNLRKYQATAEVKVEKYQEFLMKLSSQFQSQESVLHTDQFIKSLQSNLQHLSRKYKRKMEFFKASVLRRQKTNFI